MEANVKNWFTACTLLTGLCLGCSDASSTNSAGGKSGSNEGRPVASPPPAPKPFVEGEKAAASETPAGKEAKPGAGIQGKGYGESPIIGPITAPVRARFVAEQQINLNLMQHTLDLYKAEHDGKGPKSHEEFMKVIIADGAIKLPTLPAGQRYRYDAKTEKLMVVEGS